MITQELIIILQITIFYSCQDEHIGYMLTNTLYGHVEHLEGR